MTSYSEKEKMLLAHLVRENNTVENKRTDNTSLGEKRLAWETICSVYNCQPEINTPRTVEQLKKLWCNLKQRKRKQNTEMRHSMLATGGGPAKKQAVDAVLDFVQDAAPHLDVTIPCSYDSTYAFEREESLDRTMEAEELNETNDITVPLLKIRKPRARTSSSSDTTSYGVPSSSKHSEVNAAATAFSSSSLLRGIDIPTPARSKRISLSAAAMPERNARLQRVERSMAQDEDIHKLRMQVLHEELEKVKLDRQKAEFEKQKAAAEAEQAILSLENFKNQVGSA